MPRKFKYLIGIIFVLSLAVFARNFVLADSGFDPGITAVETEIKLSNEDPRVIAARVIQFFLGFLGILAVGLIMYGGFVWMTSQGNEDKITQARNILKNAVIGLIIILASFAIASFVLRMLSDATGLGLPGSRNGGGNRGGGVGALGACSIQSVYPEHLQNGVARNTSIIVTFKEEIDASTICDSVDANNRCVSGAVIRKENVRIFKTDIGDSCDVNDDNCEQFNTVDVYAMSNDNKTFVFIPKSYLGSASESLWYTVYLSNAIKKTDGKAVFANCATDYFNWQFKVSTEIDLTSPQVKENGVFPVPDSEKDVIGADIAATQAKGSIKVLATPLTEQVSVYSGFSNGAGSPDINVNMVKENEQSGELFIAVTADGQQASLENKTSGEKLGLAEIRGQSVLFDGILALSLYSSSASFSAGNSWTISNVRPYKPAQKLRVDGVDFIFVSQSEKAKEPNNPRTIVSHNGSISVINGSVIGNTLDNSDVAKNIKDAIEAMSNSLDVVATVSGDEVRVIAKEAGEKGNGISLSTDNASTLGVSSMLDGKDQGEPEVKDKKDKPRNSVIQINFNEAMLPMLVSGSAQELVNHIRVKCTQGCVLDNQNFFSCGNDICVKGSFFVSNQYKNVEFVSNNKCFTNECGDDIYCLPGDSQIEVSFDASALASCVDDNACRAKAPYTRCIGQKCQDGDGNNYPGVDILAASFPDGIMDAAFNSLDGNRNDNPEGPSSFYNENNKIMTNGDSFKWTFFINNKIESDSPEIESTNPVNGFSDASLSLPLEVVFNKVMMSDSLKTGSIVSNGKTHQAINLWGLSNESVGYWVRNENIFNASGEPVKTSVFIEHSNLSDLKSYRAQVGSGVKDIYQNCFKPSKGPACPGVNKANPSCCSGSASPEPDCQ